MQGQYLQFLMQGHSIAGMVDFYLKQGWLVHFTELFNLLKTLCEQQLISNPEVKEYFQQLNPTSESSFLKAINPFAEKTADTNKYSSQKLMELPFFRSLPTEWSHHLLKSAKTLVVPQNMLLIKQGAMDRDLYVMLSGHASVIKTENGMKQVIAQLASPSVFGEGSFFLGHPRSADILTRAECEVLKVPYTAEMESFIRKDMAEAAQIRIWIQHALSSSALFKNIPSDALDALTFAGRPVRIPARQCLFAEGQQGNASYILIQGEMIVSQKGKIINQLKQGAFLGEIAMLASGGVRTASIHASSDCLLMEIQQNAFYSLLGQNILIAKELEQLAFQRLEADRRR